MLFLLPPSETKRVGGDALSISQISQTFGVLSGTRKQLVDLLSELAIDESALAEVLKLSKKQLWEIEHLRNLWDAPTLQALSRYTGTLYEAIDVETLSEAALLRARDLVLIQSALFGLVSAADRIPFYRLSANTRLPGVNLKNLWGSAHAGVFARLAPSAPIVDFRSKAYSALAEIPNDIEHYWVEVLARGADKKLKALNHFNKKSKGEFMRAILLADIAPQSLDDLAVIANSIGFELELGERKLNLIIPGN